MPDDVLSSPTPYRARPTPAQGTAAPLAPDDQNGLLPPTIDPWGWWDASTIAAASGCPVDAITLSWPAIAREMDAAGCWSHDDAIAAIGTIAVETASTFRPIHEYGSTADWIHYDGGPDYAGRGFAQLTHLANYRKCGDAIGLNLVLPDGDPDLLLTVGPSAKSFAWFYVNHGVPSKDGSHYYTLQELAAEADYYWFRTAWSGASRGMERMAQVRSLLLGSGSTERHYVDSVPDDVVLQAPDNWTCAVRSTRAALWALAQREGAPEPTWQDGGPYDVYDWMVPSIDTRDIGLHFADGHELVTLLQEKGYGANVVYPAALSDAQHLAGTTPLLLGGASWGHWVMVSGLEADGTLVLANPAPGYKRINNELRDSWDRLGPMTLIAVSAPAPVPAPAPGPAPEPKPQPGPGIPPTDDQLRTLVGVAYHNDGVVIPALVAAALQPDATEVRQQIGSVVSFLRTNNPDK